MHATGRIIMPENHDPTRVIGPQPLLAFPAEDASVFLTVTHGPDGADVVTFATAALRDRYAAALPAEVRERTESIDCWPLNEYETDEAIADWADDVEDCQCGFSFHGEDDGRGSLADRY